MVFLRFYVNNSSAKIVSIRVDPGGSEIFCELSVGTPGSTRIGIIFAEDKMAKKVL